MLAVSFQLCAQPTPLPRGGGAATCTLNFLASLLWVRESQGYNAGPGVALLVKGGGGNYATRPEYCGFTQAYAQRHCGLPIPRNGMQGAANAWFPLTGPDAWRTVFQRAAGRGSIDSIRVGQKAGFDYGAGIHHVGAVAALGRAVRAGRGPRSIWTLAGNEGSGATAGVKRTLYPIGAIDGLANWN
ncbi:hypothetical protein KB206_10655 [Microvirga sp. STS02]|uniref:hypothetical protein n=1 Tax=Hymenobacter negativus TaxID=2795026 RepID=UPI0018DD19A3|nr:MULTISPECIES: hypothetical protein [Bacteria]MBH8569346.1 hypothetical protein [Hymenobacter negativus]MBR7209080.1 hypothetical protein [Microvirga sp. STS02]